MNKQQQQRPASNLQADSAPDDATPEHSVAQHLRTPRGDTARGESVDTGHWGKKLHEPSPFLSHDLWSKLGGDSTVQ